MKNTPQMNPTARIAKNSLVQLAAGVLNKFLGVILVIYAARQLGTGGFGEYTFVLSMYSIFYIVADFGLGTLTTRDLAKDPERLTAYLGNVLVLRTLLSLFAAGSMVAAVAILGHPPALVGLAAIAALSLFFNSNVDTCAAVFYANQRMEIPSFLSVVAATFRVTASLGALAFGGGVLILMAIHTVAAFFNFALLLWVLVADFRPAVHVNAGFWRQLLQQAFPLALANFFSIMYFRADTVMLASISGQDAVGLYNAAYRLLEFTLIVPAYYNGAIFPVISASHNTNPQRFMLIYRRSVKYMWVASLPLAIGTAALAPRLVEVLYGQAYAACVPALRVLMWTLLLIAVNSINAPYLIAMHRQKSVTTLTLAAVLLNVGLNFWAIPRFGILGAAWTTLVSEAVMVTLFMAVLSKPLALSLRMFRHLFPPVIAAAGMYGVLSMIKGWDLGFQVMLGAAVYGALLWVVRAFDEVDLELFGRVIRPMERTEKAQG